ncbi:phosphatase PAP2 family protein [Ligilactobacillus salitolerans]|uniref:phosphatase PAP2 family protein n=1 Tax=Ligilactobacillus salitolerans TaxID=1808352 RepID=UPI000F610006|nr:phosphatase PAP2 family protein [Ligilactobacillus salitolerans]
MLKKNISLIHLIFGCCWLLVFGGWTWLIISHDPLITTLDQSASNFFQPLTTPATTRIVTAFTNLAAQPWTSIWALLIAFWISTQKNWLQGVGYFLLFNLASFCHHLLKNWLARPRPSERLVQVGGFSYPSGHTFAALLLVFSILALLRIFSYSQKAYLIWAILGWGLIILVAASRVYLHAHFLSDTLGSLFLASTGWQLLLGVHRCFKSQK